MCRRQAGRYGVICDEGCDLNELLPFFLHEQAAQAVKRKDPDVRAFATNDALLLKTADHA